MDDFNMGMWPECSFKWYKYYHCVQKRVSKCEKTVGVLQNGTHLKKTVTIWTTYSVWTNELIQHVSSCYENKADLHLHDALREVGWYFSQTFTTAVHYVVVAGAAGWTHCYLRNTSPRLCLCWTCRRQYTRLWNHHTHTHRLTDFFENRLTFSGLLQKIRRSVGIPSCLQVHFALI